MSFMSFEIARFFDWTDDDAYWNPWYGASEKSASACRREQRVMEEFDAARGKLESAIVNYKVRVVELGCKQESNSMLRQLPSDTVDLILDYVRKNKGQTPSEQHSSMMANARAGQFTNHAPRIVQSAQAMQGNKAKEGLDIKALFVPGKKHNFLLSTPDLHLTGPCWRDFSRYVRTHEGWNVKRKAATSEEKKQFRQTRNGAVYFINAVYSIPRTSKIHAAKKREADTVFSEIPAKKETRIDSEAHNRRSDEI